MDPAPHLVSEFGGTIRAGAWDGRTAYVALHSRVLALDPHAPPNGTMLGSARPLGWRIAALAARDGIVLAAGPELAVLDATDPTSITVLARLPLPLPARSVVWVGDVAWLVMGNQRIGRVELSDPHRPRLLPRWNPPTKAGAPSSPYVVTGIREHLGRVVLLTAWVNSQDGPLGWPGGELMLVDPAGDGTPVLLVRHALPCCALELLGEGDDLVTRQRFPEERAVWLRIGPDDELSSPRDLPLLTHTYANPTWAAAVFDGGYWIFDGQHMARQVPLAEPLEIGPYLDLPNGRPPALLLPAGDRLLYVLPDAFGWFASPADPLAEPPRYGTLPRLGSRAVDAMVPVEDGAIVASDGVPLIFAPREPDATFEEMAGTGEAVGDPVDDLRDLIVDGEKLYALRRNTLWHWRREGPRTLRSLGEIVLDGEHRSVERFHAADEGWLVYSNDRTLVVLRARPFRGARRFATVESARSWYGRTRIRDGLFWLRGAALGSGRGMSGLHIADDAVTRQTASFRFPAGGRVSKDVAWEGDLLVTGLDNDVWFFDMADPRDPRLLGSIEMPGEVAAATLSGTTAWVAWESQQGTTLRLYDLTVPDAPRPLGPGIPLVGEHKHIDIRFHDGFAWLLVDDVLQLRRLPTVPGSTATATRAVTATATAEARETGTPWVVVTPSEIYLPALMAVRPAYD